MPSRHNKFSSHPPTPRNAAALHIATLSHAPSLQKAIGQAGGFGSLSKLESMSSLAMASPAQRQLQRDAADYARWTLRTSHGRNYKPAFRPKSPATLRREAAATKAQAHARRRAGNERVQAARASKVLPLEHFDAPRRHTSERCGPGPRSVR